MGQYNPSGYQVVSLGELGMHPIFQLLASLYNYTTEKGKGKTMKMIIKSAVVAGVGMLAVTTMLAKGHGSQPVHTVKFTSKTTFTNANAGVDTSATGTATLSSSINGNTDKESISVSLKGLSTNSPYSLFATTSLGSNLDVVDFTAGKNGSAKLSVKNTGTKKNPATLPGGLEVFNITELDVVNESDTNGAVTVLTADTTAPQSFTFSDRLTATGTNGETGTLAITAATKKGAKLSLTASGLNASTDYLIALNGTATTNSFTSDSNGNLKVSTPITANVLDLTEVDLTDTSANIIIAFPLP